MIDEFPILRDLISLAIEPLNSLDIELELYTSPFVHPDQLEAFDSEFGITLPRDIRQLYTETDGFSISWTSGNHFGHFEFPSLYDLRLFRQRWINGDMAGRKKMNRSSASDATEILERMQMWLPFDDSGSGDLLCVDCKSGHVVKFDHECEEPAGSNGTIYAPDFFDYVKNCSRICFFSVWLTRFEKEFRGTECWINWSSAGVPSKYFVESNGDDVN